MLFRSSSLKYLALCAVLLGSFACSNNNGGGNNGDLDPGTGTGNPQTDTQTTEGQVATTTQTGINQVVGSSSSQSKFATVSGETVACAGGGTASVTGDVNSGSPTTFDLDFDFTNCTLLDGTVTVVGEFNVSGTSFNYFYTIGGEVGGNGCVVTYDGFLIDIDVPDLTNPISFQAIFDGVIGGECLNGDTSCEYDEVTINNGTVSGNASCN